MHAFLKTHQCLSASNTFPPSPTHKDLQRPAGSHTVLAINPPSLSFPPHLGPSNAMSLLALKPPPTAPSPIKHEECGDCLVAGRVPPTMSEMLLIRNEVRPRMPLRDPGEIQRESTHNRSGSVACCHGAVTRGPTLVTWDPQLLEGTTTSGLRLGYHHPEILWHVGRKTLAFSFCTVPCKLYSQR